MRTNLFSKITIASIITASILFTGCGDKEEAKVIQPAKTVKSAEVEKTEKMIEKALNEKPSDKKEEVVPTYTKYDSVVQEVFKDVAKVAPEGKQMILVFGTNTDPYTDRLKADIQGSEELQKKLKNDFSSYYFKAHENLRHKQFHEGELMDVDTKTMIAVYSIQSTPTIIFTDDNAKAVIVVPGYMPTKQFLTTMNFMAEGKWKGKNRKNGEIYESLRDYYVANGIDVKKKAE